MQTKAQCLLQTRGLGKAFGPRLVFKNLDFALHSGELLLILGPNGSGKSTLLQLLCGLLEPSRGSIALDLDLADIGYMAHETFIYSGLSALENLRFWSRLYSMQYTAQDLEQFLRRVGLTQFKHEQAGYFSRGMAQRLSLARVLLINPKLFLLDEPATGLDQESQTILRQEVEQAKKQGAAVLFVSHVPDKDLHLADGILYLQDKSGFVDRQNIEAGIEQPC